MLFRLTGPLLKAKWAIMLAIIGFQLAATSASLYLPELNARIIDEGVVVGDTSAIWHLGSIMLAFALVQAVSSGCAIVLAARLAMGIGQALRRRQFAHAQTLSSAQLSIFGPPSLITRNTNDVQQVQMIVMMTMTIMVTAPIMGVGGIVMALRQDIALSQLLLVVVPLFAIAIAFFMSRLHPQFRIQQKRIDRVNTLVREQLSGVRVIRAFVRQPTEAQKFTTANDNLRSVALRIGLWFSLMFPTFQAIIWVSQIAVLWFGGHRIESGAMPVGALIAFINYLMLIFMAVGMAAMVLGMLPRGQVSAERIHELLSTPSELTVPDQPRPLHVPGRFGAHNVTVRYEDAEVPVLNRVSLDFSPGTITGIVGPTGAGKTTLINLLPRLFDSTDGHITVNDHPISEYSLQQLRSRVALVPQRAYLFSGTIASTVAGHFRAADVDRDRVRWALEGAQAWEFVSQLDELIDAPVEAGGQNFSGGQRQRLAIARALYREADLYIFDDSFSALDAHTEAQLRADLPRYTNGAAVVIVSQKVSTVIGADQVLVLDRGRVAGLGTHDTLIKECELYREIVESQTDEEVAP